MSISHRIPLSFAVMNLRHASGTPLRTLRVANIAARDRKRRRSLPVQAARHQRRKFAALFAGLPTASDVPSA